MAHPRLSVSQICTWPLSFEQEKELWDELELHHLGLMGNKVEEAGRDVMIDALAKRDITVVTITTGHFDLSDPSSWPVTQQSFRSYIDLATVVGGAVYCTPGRRFGHRNFDELADAFTAAIEPVVGYADQQGIRLAVEPSLRTEVSFCHTLRDCIELVDRAGVSLIADLGNCWMERDYEQTVRRAGDRVAAVQFADAIIGTMQEQNPGGRAVPGDGDLAIDAFFRSALDAGYAGPFELEMVGPKIETEGHADALRRGVARSNTILEDVLGS